MEIVRVHSRSNKTEKNMHYQTFWAVFMSVIYCVYAGPLKNDLKPELKAFEKRLSRIENKLEQLTKFQSSFEVSRAKRLAVDPHVSFSAVLDHEQSSIAIGQTIIYNKVMHNDGNAYNHHTGVFTAPYNGVYIFTNFVGELHDNEIYLKLVVNGQNEVDSVAEGDSPSGNDQGGNAVILKLTAGMSVTVQAYNIGNAEIDGGSSFLYNSFSGALLYGQ